MNQNKDTINPEFDQLADQDFTDEDFDSGWNEDVSVEDAMEAVQEVVDSADEDFGFVNETQQDNIKKNQDNNKVSPEIDEDYTLVNEDRINEEKSDDNSLAPSFDNTDFETDDDVLSDDNVEEDDDSENSDDDNLKDDDSDNVDDSSDDNSFSDDDSENDAGNDIDDNIDEIESSSGGSKKLIAAVLGITALAGVAGAGYFLMSEDNPISPQPINQPSPLSQSGVKLMDVSQQSASVTKPSLKKIETLPIEPIATPLAKNNFELSTSNKPKKMVEKDAIDFIPQVKDDEVNKKVKLNTIGPSSKAIGFGDTQKEDQTRIDVAQLTADLNDKIEGVLKKELKDEFSNFTHNKIDPLRDKIEQIRDDNKKEIDKLTQRTYEVERRIKNDLERQVKVLDKSVSGIKDKMANLDDVQSKLEFILQLVARQEQDRRLRAEEAIKKKAQFEESRSVEIAKIKSHRKRIPGFKVVNTSYDGKMSIVTTPSGRINTYFEDEKFYIDGIHHVVTDILDNGRLVLVDQNLYIDTIRVDKPRVKSKQDPSIKIKKQENVVYISAEEEDKKFNEKIMGKKTADSIDNKAENKNYVILPEHPDVMLKKERLSQPAKVAEGYELNAVFPNGYLIKDRSNEFITVKEGDKIKGLGLVDGLDREGHLRVGGFKIIGNRF